MRSGVRIAALVSVLSLLVAGSLSVPATAADGATEDNCPEVLPMSEVREGVTGKGWTVADGRERRSFTADVIGILPNGLGPGRDLIVVETRGAVIEENGGIWEGMSGSPIFVNGKLLGAIAYGLSFGPETVAGVTPGAEMEAILNYPTEDPSTTRNTRRVSISPNMRRRIAFSSGAEMSEVAGSFRQLKLPVSISGAPQQVVEAMTRIVNRDGLPLKLYAGSSASSSNTVSAAATQLRPGDNMVAALSYGDSTFAAVGTTTFVCDGRVVGFGHPFLWQGATTFGLNAADSLVVVQDPFFSFELATIEEGLGTIHQDRFAGVAGTFGTMPSTIPLSTTVHALNTNRTRDGRSDVVDSDVLPFIAFGDVYGSILMAMDQYTAGSADMSWTITGTKESGEAWSLTRSNMHSSEYAISEESTFEIANALSILYFNEFEPIEFTSVDVDVTADDDIKQYTISDVLVSRDGVEFADKRRVRAAPGDTIFMRIVLSPHGRGEEQTADLSVQIPGRARTDGFIELRGGGLGAAEDDICFYDPTQCVSQTGKKIASFDDLLAFLQSRPKNNELLAKLRMGNRGRVKSEDVELLDQVVAGEASILVRIPGACCGGGGKGGAMPRTTEEEPPRGVRSRG